MMAELGVRVMMPDRGGAAMNGGGVEMQHGAAAAFFPCNNFQLFFYSSAISFLLFNSARFFLFLHLFLPVPIYSQFCFLLIYFSISFSSFVHIERGGGGDKLGGRTRDRRRQRCRVVAARSEQWTGAAALGCSTAVRGTALVCVGMECEDDGVCDG
jgi:hypothetical protein